MRRSIVCLLLMVGCAGDGSDLVETVLEPVDDPAVDAPTLQFLQDTVFTPICSPCHTPGGIGPMPLDTAAVSHANLVDVFSIEIPGLLRVDPGDPEVSYLVWKVEARPEIAGSPMPLGGPMLSADEIEAIRDWIANGALP